MNGTTTTLPQPQLAGSPIPSSSVSSVGDRSSFARCLDRLHDQLRAAESEPTVALITAVDARDAYTRDHSLNVAVHAQAIARRMDLPEPSVAAIRQAALLHDVGKIGVPDAILTKPGRLTDEEFETIRRHPQIALDILANLSSLGEELAFILHHHERFDGRGYPCGLGGERIPQGARILAVADALDTMLSPRSYKPAFPLDHVRAELISESGRQFDPKVVGVALAWLDEMSLAEPT